MQVNWNWHAERHVVRKALAQSFVQNSLIKNISIFGAKPSHLQPAQAPKWPLNVGHVPCLGRLLKHFKHNELEIWEALQRPSTWISPYQHMLFEDFDDLEGGSNHKTHRDKRFSKDIIWNHERSIFWWAREGFRRWGWIWLPAPKLIHSQEQVHNVLRIFCEFSHIVQVSADQTCIASRHLQEAQGNTAWIQRSSMDR